MLHGLYSKRSWAERLNIRNINKRVEIYTYYPLSLIGGILPLYKRRIINEEEKKY